MEKKEVIRKILEMIWSNQPATKVVAEMNKTGVTPAEVMENIQKPQTEETFDLLCEVNGELKRLPFETGRDLNPKGIFPRKNLKFWLSLDETGMLPFPDPKDKDKLPDEDISILLQEVRHELNDKLSELGKAPLRGDYWLNGHELSGIGFWMARFYEGVLKVDYYDSSHKAKVRYIGHL